MSLPGTPPAPSPSDAFKRRTRPSAEVPVSPSADFPSGGKTRKRPAVLLSPAVDPRVAEQREREDAARAVYARVWERFRLDGNIAETAAACGVPLAAVKRLVTVGVPSLSLPSLRAQLDTMTRAAVARTEAKLARVADVENVTNADLAETREKAATEAALRVKEAIGDAVKQREDEGRLVRANRESALALAMVQARLLRGSVKLAERLEGQIASEKVTTKEGLRILREIGFIAKSTAEVSRHAVHMERLLLGKPTDIVAGTTTTADEETPEETLAVAIRAFARRDARASILEGEPDGEDDSGI